MRYLIILVLALGLMGCVHTKLDKQKYYCCKETGEWVNCGGFTDKYGIQWNRGGWGYTYQCFEVYTFPTNICLGENYSIYNEDPRINQDKGFWYPSIDTTYESYPCYPMEPPDDVASERIEYYKRQVDYEKFKQNILDKCPNRDNNWSRSKEELKKDWGWE